MHRCIPYKNTLCILNILANSIDEESFLLLRKDQDDVKGMIPVWEKY